MRSTSTAFRSFTLRAGHKKYKNDEKKVQNYYQRPRPEMSQIQPEGYVRLIVGDRQFFITVYLHYYDA